MTASLSRPAALRTFLAFDFGTRRTGVAVGNSLLREASPLGSVAAEGDARFEPITRLIAEWQPDALVLGVPCHPDGAPHERLGKRILDDRSTGSSPSGYRLRAYKHGNQVV